MKTIKEYKLVKFLGKGAFGEIYLAQKLDNQQLYAAKVLDKKRMDSPKLKKYLDREIAILKKLDHPNIVKFYEQFDDKDNYYIIIEYCNGGNLLENLKKYIEIYNEPFSIEIIQHLMREIIRAFGHIHSNRIIHRDIKLQNILLSYDNENDKKNFNLMKAKVKIIDFGVAIEITPDGYAYTRVGSVKTMDPLILNGKYEGYTEKADVWSLGVIFYQLLTGQGLFKTNNMEEIMKKIEEGNYSVPINKNFYKESVSFLNCMLQYDPDDRISVQNLAQHDFIHNNVKDFTKANFEKIFNKIDKNGLNINFKENGTICKVFNSDKAILNQLKNKSANSKNKNQLNGANNYLEEPYVFKGDIYGTDPKIINKNNGKISEINNNNFNQIEELINFETNLIQSLRIDKEKENNETEKPLKDKKEKEIKEKEIKYKNEDKKEELKVYIKGLLDEYNSAKEYFIENGLTKQEQDAKAKYNNIQFCLQSIEKGIPINLESLPKPISPEYIYNCPVSQRNSIFQEIINQYIENKTDLEANLKNSIIKYKKMDVNCFRLIKNDIMLKLENEKNKLEKYKNEIELLKNGYNNEWVPAPDISRNVEIGKFERIIFKDCIYKLTIHTTKKNYYYNSNNRFLIRFNMKINENKNYCGDVNIVNYGDFENDIIWDLNDNEWNNLSNYYINVDFYLDKVFKGNQKIDISKLKHTQQIKISYPITFLNQPEKAIINFEIKIDIPEGKKITLNGRREVINVKKIFPPFEGKSPYTNDVPLLLTKKV